MNIPFFIIAIVALNLFIFFAYTYGFSVYRIFYKNLSTESSNENYYCAIPIIGFAILSIIANYLYFFFNLTSNTTAIFLLIIFFISFFFIKIEIKNFINFYLKILLRVNPIFILIVSFLLINGEEFYIFRGNYWDNMNYISQAILIQDYRFSDILKFSPFSDYSYVDNGIRAITLRPLTSFFLAQFFNLKLFSFFFNIALYKIFLISLAFLSINFLADILKLKAKYFFSIGYIFSFWLMYVVEIDATAHLTAVPLFIFSMALLIQSKNSLKLKDNINSEIFILVLISIFFFYVEIFPILFIVISLFFLFKFKEKIFLLLNLKTIFLYSLVFFIVTLPLYSTTYGPLLNQIEIGLRNDITYWTYFSSFIIGKGNIFLTDENIEIIKQIIKEKNSFILLRNLIDIMIEVKYFLIPLNVIPSLFGLYFLTISSVSSLYDVFWIFFLLILNFYLIKIFFTNLRYVFKNNNNLSILFKSSVISFFLLFVVLFFRNGYWQLTKLYIYFGPIIFLFMYLKLDSSNTLKSESSNALNFFRMNNNIYLFLLILFPIYKFSTFNYGIGRYDTFPSIINPKYKKDINWKLNESEYMKCSQIFIDSADPIINGYVSIKLRDLGFKHVKSNMYDLEYKSVSPKKCKVQISKNNFTLTY
jgi:hypothetical protein